MPTTVLLHKSEPRSASKKTKSGFLFALTFVVLAGCLTIAGCEGQEQPAQAAPAQDESAAPATPDTSDKDASADRQQFWKTLHSLDPSARFISGVSKGATENDAKIRVTNDFLEQNYHARLQLAQNLWGVWAKIHSPPNPDQSLISLVDCNGNSVGGSSNIAGSMVSVDKD